MRLAGLLHDVGKIGVPDAILNKPAQLTADEYARHEHHRARSDRPRRRCRAAARCVRHHHERFDGGGYPDGLAGD